MAFTAFFAIIGIGAMFRQSGANIMPCARIFMVKILVPATFPPSGYSRYGNETEKILPSLR